MMFNQPSTKWAAKQVTKKNFQQVLEDVKSCIYNSDYISISIRKTGSYSSSWHRIFPFDDPEIAYCKAKSAAERFQLLQFAICAFSIKDSSSVVAHPYNFHLFPRDESNKRVPCYSFYCQPSHLESLAKEGLDFNTCVYDGISYLSREQEEKVKGKIRNGPCHDAVLPFSSMASVADLIFIERIKSHVKHWRNKCSSMEKSEGEILLKSEPLIRCFRGLNLSGELYGSRPSISFNVCSERQVQLIFEMVHKSWDNLVPVVVPAKPGGIQAVRLVFTASSRDKALLMDEIQATEEEQTRKIRGFREVIEFISASQKPIITNDPLNDMATVYSKFTAPLPEKAEDFLTSLTSVFPLVIDIPLFSKKSMNPRRRMPSFSPPIITMELRPPVPIDECRRDGLDVIKTAHLFTKMLSTGSSPPPTFVRIRAGGSKVSSCRLVFLWPLKPGASPALVKRLLLEISEASEDDFEVQMVDESCAVATFSEAEKADRLLKAETPTLNTAGYEIYRNACCLYHLRKIEGGLAEYLDRAVIAAAEPEGNDNAEVGRDGDQEDDFTINFDDL